MARHKSAGKKAPPEIGLHMECFEEELDPVQVEYYNKAEKEYKEIRDKVDEYIKKFNGEIVEKAVEVTAFQINITPPAPPPPPPAPPQPPPPPLQPTKATRQSAQPQNFQPIMGHGILTRSSAGTASNTYLMMDPRIGLVVSQVPPTPVTPDQAVVAPIKSTPTPTRARPTPQPPPPPPAPPVTRTRSGGKQTKPVAAATPPPPPPTPTEPAVSTPVTRTRSADKNKQPQTPPVNNTTPPQPVPAQQQQQQQSQQQQQPPPPPPPPQVNQVFSAPSTTTPSGNYRLKSNAKQQPTPSKPAENTALGGLSAGSKTPWKPSSEEGSTGKGNIADSREVTFNKLSGKTFPSLVVVARPHLRLKDIPQSSVSQERSTLDSKVKGVLMYTPTKFTEWLIQQGLIRSEQSCQTHCNNDLTAVKLKLGMYSDVSKFPYSGGYVWISECCPTQFVSVFSGSVFEGAPHPPTTLLKLIYHWACQTNVQNVVQWVKVDNFYVKNFFTNMRAICTQAVHQKYQKLGGARKKVEVGVISLGTTSQDGNMRQVKVEVLGVMDPESKLIRLRAVEPLSDERNFKRRFIKILEPLEEWVHKESSILTDFTVDKGTLNSMGFHTVYQVSITDPPSKYSNQNVMEYLRRIVPRMFQNTLSLLSRQIIQQFLDELVWREMWGPIASQAFDNIISHMAEQTKLDASDSLLVRLSMVASNPFKVWDYSAWKPPNPALTVASGKTPQLAESPAPSPPLSKLSRSRKRPAEVAVPEPPPPAQAAKKVAKVVKDKPKKEEKPKINDRVKKDKDIGERDKQVTDDVVSFINDGLQIPLESYYYGSRPGEAEALEEYKGVFVVKCPVCNKKFHDNVVLMKHILLHCQLEPEISVNINKVHQCLQCFMGFNTSNTLKSHMEEVHHVRSKGGFICQICEEKFKDRVGLIYHMHRTHVEMELPYECGICKFRSSVYKVLVDHFIEVHRKGEHVLCPFCLKIVSLSYRGKVITPNTLFYLSHIEKHYRKALTKKCDRCVLSFIHKGIWEQHMEADHCSFKFEYGVKPFNASTDGITMPEPGQIIKPIPPPKQIKSTRSKNSHYAVKLFFADIEGVEDDMACMECEGSLSKSDHFNSVLNCLRCRYSTCCEKAMMEHVSIFHDSQLSQFTMGKPIMLSEVMYCVCGYYSGSGNRLAKHIAVCERRSAYPTEAAAKHALRPRGHNKPDPGEECNRCYLDNPFKGEPQNMLNMLGLVRKSPDTPSTVPDTNDSQAITKSDLLTEKSRLSVELKIKQEKGQDPSDEVSADSRLPDMRKNNLHANKMEINSEKSSKNESFAKKRISVPKKIENVNNHVAMEEDDPMIDKSTAEAVNV